MAREVPLRFQVFHSLNEYEAHRRNHTEQLRLKEVEEGIQREQKLYTKEYALHKSKFHAHCARRFSEPSPCGSRVTTSQSSRISVFSAPAGLKHMSSAIASSAASRMYQSLSNISTSNRFQRIQRKFSIANFTQNGLLTSKGSSMAKNINRARRVLFGKRWAGSGLRGAGGGDCEDDVDLLCQGHRSVANFLEEEGEEKERGVEEEEGEGEDEGFERSAIVREDLKTINEVQEEASARSSAGSVKTREVIIIESKGNNYSNRETRSYNNNKGDNSSNSNNNSDNRSICNANGSNNITDNNNNNNNTSNNNNNNQSSSDNKTIDENKSQKLTRNSETPRNILSSRKRVSIAQEPETFPSTPSPGLRLRDENITTGSESGAKSSLSARYEEETITDWKSIFSRHVAKPVDRLQEKINTFLVEQNDFNKLFPGGKSEPVDSSEIHKELIEMERKKQVQKKEEKKKKGEIVFEVLDKLRIQDENIRFHYSQTIK